MELDDTIPEAHAELALIRTYSDWDWSAAESAYKRALSLNPNSAYAHDVYGILYLSPIGRHDEAIAEMKRAVELDPLSPLYHHDLAWAFYYARQYDQAIEQLRKTLEMGPNFGYAHRTLGLVYLKKGMYEEAIAELQKSGYLGDLGYAYAVLGKRDQALKLLAELKERSKQEHVDPFDFAQLYTGLGEKDQAFEWLKRLMKSALQSYFGSNLIHIGTACTQTHGSLHC